MTIPTSAPAIIPDVETVRARKPSHAVAAFTPIAQGSADTTAGADASTAALSIRLAIQSTTAAAAGTEMLSSSRIGIVSTKPANAAAASGAATVKTSGGGAASAGRTHHVSATAPRPPNAMNAAVPATDLSGHHGHRCARRAEIVERPGDPSSERAEWSPAALVVLAQRPASVAVPSPSASTAHAAAVMSGR